MDSEPDTSAPPRAEEVIRVGEHYYVLAVAARADERTRVLKDGDTFGVFDAHGDVVGDRLSDHGMYHDGMRHLSRLMLTVNGLRPLLLSSGVGHDNVVLDVDQTNPDLSADGTITVPRGAVHILRRAVLWDGVLHQRLRVHNFGLQALELRFTLRFEADFHDMFEVRGVRRKRRGRILGARVDGSSVVMGYEGLDGVARSTRVLCDPAPATIGPDRIELLASLGPGERLTYEVRFECAAGASEHRTPTVSYDDARTNAGERARAMLERACHIQTNHEPFNEWLERSHADLLLMISDTARGQYPYAGVPWFSTPFGRDGLVTALQTLWTDPDIARGVLSFLGGTQALEADPAIDAEPGKIVHEIRRGEMAAIGEVPYKRYYGSVDSTPLFVLLAGEYLRVTGETAFITELWPAIDRALRWIETDGDRDRDGFVEYACSAPEGLCNQGWKDSGDSVFHADGSLATSPVALVEVQGYVYAAWHAGAEIAHLMGDHERAAHFKRRAAELRERFTRDFWDEQLGMFVLAIDGRKKPCRVATSNAGHCLFTGIADDDHARRVIREMSSPRFFTGWGVRTVAADQVRYNPMSYHNGSVWPHDVSLIALGMSRYGCPAQAAQLMDAMLDLSQFVELGRLPELLCGFERGRGEGPVRYPVACSPQSWAAGSVFLMLRACLGLSIHAERREIHFHDPTLPDFLDVVELRNLRVGPARVDLVIQRQTQDVSVNLLRRATGVRVIVTR